jgi:hypothetical protein
MYASVHVPQKPIPEGKYMCADCCEYFDKPARYGRIIWAECDGHKESRNETLCHTCHLKSLITSIIRYGDIDKISWNTSPNAEVENLIRESFEKAKHHYDLPIIIEE